LLLFLLSIGSGKAGIERTTDEATLEEMRQKLSNIEAENARKLEQVEALKQREQERLSTYAQAAAKEQELESQIKELESELSNLQSSQQALKAEQEQLSVEQKAHAAANRVLQSFEYENLPPIGLPAEATHVAFIIDTSGSMRNRLTNELHYGVVAQINELLKILPAVQKIQFLDTSGNYMLKDQKGFWINDTPGLRSQALNRVLNYPILSVSDPEPGIRRAFRDLKPNVPPNGYMSLYVIGDDFRGSKQSFLLKLDRLNPKLAGSGKRAVSISGIGFPTSKDPFQIGGLRGNTRFADIMREIAEAHDGVLILKPKI